MLFFTLIVTVNISTIININNNDIVDINRKKKMKKRHL